MVLLNIDRPALSVDPISDVNLLRRRLAENGYFCVAVRTGTKRPAEPGWQRQTEAFRPARGGALSTGIRTGAEVLCIDVDRDDAADARDVVRRIMGVLGPTPLMRTRANSCRMALVYQAMEHGIAKTTISLGPDVVIDGISKKQQIEVLGVGQQFVAFGAHESGVEYEWLDQSPEEVAVIDLPGIDRNDLIALCEEFGVEDEPEPAAPKEQSSAIIRPPNATLPAPSGDNFFRNVKDLALANLRAWVPVLLPAAREKPAGVWRISSRRLGRNLQEDLSITTKGIQDFGLEESRTAIDLVMEHGGAPDAEAAALWLCGRIGVDPASLGHRHGSLFDDARKAYGAEIAGGLLAGSRQTGTAAKLAAPTIAATPFEWIDASTIPPREWLYGRHLVRGYVSATVAPGGVGKSSLIGVEAIAVATGQDLLGILPEERAKVWVINLEDPDDELRRRTAANLKHHGIGPAQINGWLFVNSGRSGQFVIAKQTKNGTEFAHPVVDAIVREIKAKDIGLVVVDPFVACHQVSENDNSALNDVVGVWRHIADETNCAIELVHHVRKTNGSEITVEDSRGGSSLHGAVRSMRAINPMSDDEAARAGVENRRLYFRVDPSGKANLAPGGAPSEWYHLASVDLENARNGRPSDLVGVVERWRWPNAFEDVTPTHLTKAQAAARSGFFRKDPQATDWFGHVVADIIGLDTGKRIKGKKNRTSAQNAARAKVSDLINSWLANGALVEEQGIDARRMQVTFIRCGEDEEPPDFAPPD